MLIICLFVLQDLLDLVLKCCLFICLFIYLFIYSSGFACSSFSGRQEAAVGTAQQSRVAARSSAQSAASRQLERPSPRTGHVKYIYIYIYSTCCRLLMCDFVFCDL
jgi:hypothetical protein